MSVEVVVNVGDENGKCNAAPEFFYIGLCIGAMLAERINDIGVGVLARISGVCAEQGCRRNVHETATARGPLETANQRDRNTVTVDETRISSIDSSGPGELERKNFSLRNRALVTHAGELADRERAIVIDDRAFRAKTAERCTSAAQVSKIRCSFRVRLDGARGREQSFQLNQRRRSAAALLMRTLEDPRNLSSAFCAPGASATRSC